MDCETKILPQGTVLRHLNCETKILSQGTVLGHLVFYVTLI